MTWLLPERFSESEIGPEAGFLNFYNFLLLLLSSIRSLDVQLFVHVDFEDDNQLKK